MSVPVGAGFIPARPDGGSAGCPPSRNASEGRSKTLPYDDRSEGEDQILFLGAFEAATRAMGPGVRACIWVRGCPMRCRECATPEFLAFPEGHPYPNRSAGFYCVLPKRCAKEDTLQSGREGVKPSPTSGDDTASVSALCAQIDAAIAEHGITGVSFSGGEPFAQARGLAVVAQHARARGLSTLSWSGFSRAFLASPRAPDGAKRFLAQLDVLIDGPFVARRVNGDPLRGSSNQRIHLLTERHRPEEFEESIVEVRMDADGVTVTSGVMEYAATDAILSILGVNTDDANPSRR